MEVKVVLDSKQFDIWDIEVFIFNVSVIAIKPKLIGVVVPKIGHQCTLCNPKRMKKALPSTESA